MSSSSSSNVNVDNGATGSFTEQPQATDNDSSLTQVLYMGRAHSAPGNKDTATVYCKVRIDGIQNSSKWFYYTCPACFSLKGVQPIDTTFWCSSCEEICAEPILRYKLQLEVTDEISLVGLTVIDEDAEFVVGKPAAALFAECQGNQDATYNMFQSIIGTSQIVEIKSHNYFDIGDLEGFICTWVFKRTINHLSQTMQMMYGIVARELKTMQLEGSHPQDYLNFYCLGNREEIPQELLSEAEQSDANGAKANKVCDSMKNQRFMIYVHAKGMIVDDEYVILGSANINQRSLAGSKDTEIAMGAYQHRHTWGHKKKPPRGQVYGYRTSLWAEHLGMLEPLLNEPESLECVRKVNKIAEENWKRFTDENFMKLQGHLLRYPLDVDAEGNVDHYSDQDSFPDVGGRILGAPSPTLPDVLTT